MLNSFFLVIRAESNRPADDANTGAETNTIIKNEIKAEATTDSYADDVLDSKDRLQTLIASTNIKSE